MGNLPVIFKQGKEETINNLPKSPGQLIVTYESATQANGKLWFDTSNSKRINIVPDIVDCGGWYGTYWEEDCCFIAGTQVSLADGSTASIESLEKDMLILSYDIDSKNFYTTKIKSIIINHHSLHMAQVILENDVEVIMTDYHPLLTTTGWHSLTNHNGYELLTTDDYIITLDGPKKIKNIIRYSNDNFIDTYTIDAIDLNENLDNDKNDNFIANGIVVHNASSCK